MIVSASILIVAAGAATVNFTFSVTNASITTSGTAVSVSGPATITVSGVGTDTGTFSASGSLANVSGGNVTIPFTDTFGHGTLTGNMTFPEGVLVGSAPVSGSATITSATGMYAGLANTTVTGSGFFGLRAFARDAQLLDFRHGQRKAIHVYRDECFRHHIGD